MFVLSHTINIQNSFKSRWSMWPLHPGFDNQYKLVFPSECLGLYSFCYWIENKTSSVL